MANVDVGGVWYGPSYPDAGDPPAGSVTRDDLFEGEAVAVAETPPAAARKSARASKAE